MNQLVFAMLFCIVQSDSNYSINPITSQRVTYTINSTCYLEILNPDSLYIGILFHKFPGKFSIEFNANKTTDKRIDVNDIDNMQYFYLPQPQYNSIIIRSDDEITLDFSIFLSNFGCTKDDEYFISSKNNQTFVFSNDNEFLYKLNPKSTKCILLDPGGQFSFKVYFDQSNNIQTYLNSQIFDKFNEQLMSSIPLFFTINLKDVDFSPNLTISYISDSSYDNTYQSSLEPTLKPKPKPFDLALVITGVPVIMTIYIIFGIIYLKKKRSQQAEPTQQLGAYNPDDNHTEENQTENAQETISYRRYSGDKTDSALTETENEIFYPPKDIYFNNEENTNQSEESDQLENADELSQDNIDENPYTIDETACI